MNEYYMDRLILQVLEEKNLCCWCCEKKVEKGLVKESRREIKENKHTVTKLPNQCRMYKKKRKKNVKSNE